MPDFLFNQLGVPPTMDYSLAARTMLFDVSDLVWSEEMLDLAQLDAARLSPTAPSGTILGEIAPAVAQELGLATGAVAVVGAHDHPAGSVGCGAISEGVVMDATGTVECIAVVSRRLVLGPELLDNNLPIAAHPIPGMYVVLAWSSVGGALLRWYRDNFARAEVQEADRTGESVYDVILAQAVTGPSPVLLLPHFVGTGTPWLDPASKGAILGLDLSTSRGQIIKGILDGVTYEIKLSVDAMEEAGVPVREVRAIGGGAKSELWLQTKADIWGKPVVAMDVSEAPCLGCAILAGVATGAFPSVEAGIAQMVRTRRTYEPDLAQHERYMEKARLFGQIYPALAALNHQM
jgi:xylulokinase